jgi:hypothetical protein
MAGLSGIPGFNDLDKLLTWAKQFVPDSMYEKVADFDMKLWALENLGESAVYGAVSDLSGVGMTNRLSAPGMGDMITAPGGPVLDIAKQVGNAAGALASPSSSNIAQSVLSSAPAGLQGLLETTALRDTMSVPRKDEQKNEIARVYGKTTDVASREGQYARTPKEESLRRWGLRSQDEVVERELNYKTNVINSQVKERSKGMVEKYYDAVRNGNMAKVNQWLLRVISCTIFVPATPAVVLVILNLYPVALVTGVVEITVPITINHHFYLMYSL